MPDQASDDTCGDLDVLRAAVQETVLRVCGERGYRDVVLADVLIHSGCTRACFHRLFAGKEDCFAAAYDAEANRLETVLIGEGDSQSWSACLSTTLAVLARWVSERPAVAKAIVLESHVAGGPARARHELLLERFSDAIDAARQDPACLHSPPPLTARFLARAVEGSAATALVRDAPERFVAMVPELAQLTATPFLGEDAARSLAAGLRVI